MKLQESGEMYLETILILSKSIKELHAIDIHKEMGFSKPSVSKALKKLKDNNYINIDENDVISFTKSGKTIAENIYEKHQILTQVLIELGVDEKIAQDDACRIEHVISDSTFNAIKKHIKKK